MTTAASAIVMTIGLLGCAAGEAHDVAPDKMMGLTGLMYRRGDAGDVIQCQGSPLPKICGSVDISAAEMFSDCSTAEFECLFNNADVMAVPKTALSPGQKYKVFGATLTVEQCFAVQTPCAVALIRSECADPKDCECRSPLPGRQAHFYFSQEFGVLSYYAINDPATTGLDAKQVADSRPLVTYNLVAQKGFFRKPLALPKATQVGNCRKQ